MKKVSVQTKGHKHFNFSSTAEDCVTQQHFLLERINAFYYMSLENRVRFFCLIYNNVSKIHVEKIISDYILHYGSILSKVCSVPSLPRVPFGSGKIITGTLCIKEKYSLLLTITPKNLNKYSVK